MKQPAQIIACNLKNLRERRNLSLDKLSALTGVSKSMLRQIENEKSSPTISTIWKIANGLRVSFTALLKNPETKVEVKSFTSRQPLTAESDHYRLFPLVPFDPHQNFETYFIELDAHTAFTSEPHEDNVVEYVFVLSGTIRVLFDEQQQDVPANSFLKFPADSVHTYENPSKTAAKAIVQVCYLN